MRLAESRFGADMPGLVAQFNRMAAQIERQRKELAASAARFRSMIDDAPEAIIVADYRSGLVVEANAATARMFSAGEAVMSMAWAAAGPVAIFSM